MVTSFTSAAGSPTSSTESANASKHCQSVVLCSSEKERAAQLAINLIHGKWKMEILCELEHGVARLSQLRRSMPNASAKMLTMHLRQLEQDQLIVRTDLSRRLRHVEYSLSQPHGFATLELINILAAWGAEYMMTLRVSGSNTE